MSQPVAFGVLAGKSSRDTVTFDSNDPPVRFCQRKRKETDAGVQVDRKLPPSFIDNRLYESWQ